MYLTAQNANLTMMYRKALQCTISCRLTSRVVVNVPLHPSFLRREHSHWITVFLEVFFVYIWPFKHSLVPPLLLQINSIVAVIANETCRCIRLDTTCDIFHPVTTIVCFRFQHLGLTPIPSHSLTMRLCARLRLTLLYLHASMPNGAAATSHSWPRTWKTVTAHWLTKRLQSPLGVAFNRGSSVAYPNARYIVGTKRNRPDDWILHMRKLDRTETCRVSYTVQCTVSTSIESARTDTAMYVPQALHVL